jgi:hypothetical protein
VVIHLLARLAAFMLEIAGVIAGAIVEKRRGH